MTQLLFLFEFHQDKQNSSAVCQIKHHIFVPFQSQARWILLNVFGVQIYSVHGACGKILLSYIYICIHIYTLHTHAHICTHTNTCSNKINKISVTQSTFPTLFFMCILVININVYLNKCLLWSKAKGKYYFLTIGYFVFDITYKQKNWKNGGWHYKVWLFCCFVSRKPNLVLLVGVFFIFILLVLWRRS